MHSQAADGVGSLFNFGQIFGEQQAPTADSDGSSHLFLCILFSFFAFSAPPFPRQFSSPKSSLSGTSDLLFLVEERQPAGAGFWGRFWTRSPHRKKRKVLSFWRAKKVSLEGSCRSILETDKVGGLQKLPEISVLELALFKSPSRGGLTKMGSVTF